MKDHHLRPYHPTKNKIFFLPIFEIWWYWSGPHVTKETNHCEKVIQNNSFTCKACNLVSNCRMLQFGTKDQIRQILHPQQKVLLNGELAILCIQL